MSHLETTPPSTRARVCGTGSQSSSRSCANCEVRTLPCTLHPRTTDAPPGKPHPRWAETSFRDGDPNEKWHSRATKCAPLPKRHAPPPGSDEHLRGGGPGGGRALLSPIKTEPLTEANAHLYRFSASPAPSMRYHTFQADVRSDSASSFEDGGGGGARYGPAGGSQGGGMPYSGPPPPNGANANGGGYTNGGGGGPAPSSYSDGGGGGGGYPGSDDGHAYGEHYSAGGGSPPMHYSCSCRAAPALGAAYMNLAQTVSAAIGALRQFGPHHQGGAQCAVYRRVLELHSALQCVFSFSSPAAALTPLSSFWRSSGTDSPGLVGPAYDSGPPSDSEIMTPLSASSGHASFHTGSPGVSPQEWTHMAAAGFNPYFPVAPEHHSVYGVGHVMS